MTHPILERMRGVRLRMLESVEGVPSSLEVPDVMRCVPLCMLEVVDGV